MKIVAVLGCLGIFAAGSALAADDCNIPRANVLLKSPATRYIMVGEMHGTREGPATFGDLVCTLAKSGRKIVVGVEIPAEQQATLDAFLASDGGADATKALLQGTPWNWPEKTGQNSQAMLALLTRLRTMYRLHTILGVRYIVDPNSGDNHGYEQGIADGMSRASSLASGTLVMVLTGNIHASKQAVSFGGPSYQPTAMLLPAGSEISLNLDSGPGSAWNCTGGGPQNCGPHPYAGGDDLGRGVHLGVAGALWDGVLSTGSPATASPPA